MNIYLIMEKILMMFDLKDIEALKRVGPPEKGQYKGGFDGMMVQRNLLMKYGGFSKDEKKRSYFKSYSRW